MFAVYDLTFFPHQVAAGMMVVTGVMAVVTGVMEETGAIVGATRVAAVVEDTTETGKTVVPFLLKEYLNSPVINL